ncbi:branched-chain amino acid transporter permease [Staphylococcus kloosii]|uniref:branched-chain amino acid transporter permease n=1 Tax=Staphylococcus kloosii TaxID=29384 RepID=UPI00189C8B36|nr:AzlD domain-containing protein [Staphylococcus kloosii]MBF7025327.1 AzlD domain-containing protein [Staphylococcus kloosii]
MPIHEKIITIIVIILATMLTRFLPFILFKDEDKTPNFIFFLGNVLPPAIFGMLVVYSLKDVSVTYQNLYGLPELIAIGIIVILHYFKRNMFLSMIVGTVVYISLNIIL